MQLAVKVAPSRRKKPAEPEPYAAAQKTLKPLIRYHFALESSLSGKLRIDEHISALSKLTVLTAPPVNTTRDFFLFLQFGLTSHA